MHAKLCKLPKGLPERIMSGHLSCNARHLVKHRMAEPTNGATLATHIHELPPTCCLDPHIHNFL